MNREIKFRAWDLETMHYGVFVTGSNEVYDPNGGFWRKVENIMQYTGLKDKNGKEIYEGDVVSTFKLTENGIGVIKYHEDIASFVVDEFITGGWDSIEIAIEVIGNIYENPELI